LFGTFGRLSNNDVCWRMREEAARLAFIIWWIAAFIVRNVRTSLEQRRVLEDARGGGAMMVAATAGRDLD